MGEEFRCAYPGCRKEGLYKQEFKLINEEGAFVELLFCEYHHLIVMGGHFKAKIIKPSLNLLGEIIGRDFELIGPLLEVEVAEQVIGAREMLLKLKSNNKE